MLVEHLQQRDIKAFRDAVSHGEVTTVRRLIALPHVKEHVNAPVFAFGQRAAHVAARHAPMLEELIAAGADLNLESGRTDRTPSLTTPPKRRHGFSSRSE